MTNILTISGTSKKVVPQTVSGLMATPFANGTVRLQWSRNGNAPAVVFNVMVSDDSLNWSPLGGVTRTSITLNGFAPGEKKYFRIVATRGIASAVPSEPIVIYSNSGGNDLSVAA